MTIELPKNATKKQVKNAIKKMEESLKKKKKGKGNIAHLFGTCKSVADGLEFKKN